MLAVGTEPAHAEPPDVLQQQSPGPQPPAQFHRPREQVAFIGGAELPARHRERRARNAAREQVHAGIGGRIPDRRVRDVSLGHLPGRPVRPQRGAGRRVEFDGQGVLETGPLQAQGLPACSRADLDHVKIRHAGLLPPTASAHILA